MQTTGSKQHLPLKPCRQQQEQQNGIFSPLRHLYLKKKKSIVNIGEFPEFKDQHKVQGAVSDWALLSSCWVLEIGNNSNNNSP